jgi:hypothetical protein
MITRSAPTAFRSSVSTSRLVTALVAGIVATHIATVTGTWYEGINLPPLNWPNFNGILLLGANASPLAQFWAGTAYHYLTGISFALFFAFVLHPLIRLPNSFGGNVMKGILFGLVLATISAIWWVPQLFNSVFGTDLGWFSQRVGPKFFNAGAWEVPVGIYLWHIIYGFNLGAFYNPLPAET